MKKISFITLIICVLLLGASCGRDKGNRVESGKLSVYFDLEKDEDLAVKTAKFWEENGLTTGEAQDLKLTCEDSTYQLNMIVSESKAEFVLSATERLSLMKLQTMLGDSIFGSGKIELVLCDNEFKALANINK